jgi:hypothetical protein
MDRGSLSCSMARACSRLSPNQHALQAPCAAAFRRCQLLSRVPSCRSALPLRVAACRRRPHAAAAAAPRHRPPRHRCGRRAARAQVKHCGFMVCFFVLILFSVSLMMEGAAQKGIALRDAAKQQQVRQHLQKLRSSCGNARRQHAWHARSIHPVAARRQRQRRVGVILQNSSGAGLPPLIRHT